MDFYLVIVILLFVLAVSDLIVGVSNDAVNFLNSAVGSRVAPRHIIMIVASLGIFLGATFSSGMMEVARKGIFNPEYFLFSEVMIIFLAVMLTDIILLDIFNTFGLPTSTTVSIVFELLGAAVAIAVIKVVSLGDGEIGTYINTSRALTIVAGIFISISIAFVVGSMIQFFSRMLFTFHYESRLKWAGGVWAGMALTALVYFLLIEGIRGASFVSENFIQWVTDHTLILLIGNLVLWTWVMQILISFFRINVLRFVVLFGTFSLAMAFAGNDLVNFIGVPIAGFESFTAWVQSGQDPGNMSMEVLSEPVRTNTYFLLMAGIVMVLTLWLSKKAQAVTETEVNLARQETGLERFDPNILAQGIVRVIRNFTFELIKYVPRKWRRKTILNFRPVRFESKIPDPTPPAFDLVRASVNLTMASVLIAFATSLKLPLSTTYVSFMVAMGTSLSDRAWGRESAVFRVSGVLTVIGGWFLTALVAFLIAAVFTFLIYFFGVWAIGVLVLSAVILVTRTFFHFRKAQREKARKETLEKESSMIEASGLVEETSHHVRKLFKTLFETFHFAVEGLLTEDRKKLKKAKKDYEKLIKQNEEFRSGMFSSIKRLRERATEGSKLYLLVYDLEQDMLQSVGYIVKECRSHVANGLNPLPKKQVSHLRKVLSDVDNYLTYLSEIIKERSFNRMEDVIVKKHALFIELEHALSFGIEDVKKGNTGKRNSLLFFSLILEIKDLVAIAARFVKLFRRLQAVQSGDSSMLIAREWALDKER